MQDNKGFTLLELIIIITILAIIMLIAVPNFAGIKHRMQVRADMSTSTLIAKAIRVWYTDYTTDSALHNSLNLEENESGSEDFSDKADNKFFNDEAWAKYEELTGIGEYSATYTPFSLINPDNNKPEEFQFYVVRISSLENGRKISVGITKGENEDSFDDIPFSGVVTYDGMKPGVAYVEK